MGNTSFTMEFFRIAYFEFPQRIARITTENFAWIDGYNTIIVVIL